MKLNYKIFLLIYSLLIMSAYAMKSNHGLDGYIENTIDAAKNARIHSNMGNIYFDEKKFISALKEYEIAYALTRNIPSSATYMYNIARCHMVLGNYKLAKELILGAIDKDCINMTYYEALCDCIIQLKQHKKEIEKYLSDTKNPYNKIVAGLLYFKTGQKTTAKLIFDDFVNEYPDMLITSDVKAMLNKM